MATTLDLIRQTPDCPDPDRHTHVWRIDHAFPPRSVLECPALATNAELRLDGVTIATHATMFRPLVVIIPEAGGTRLELVFHPLAPARATSRPRWRNRLVPGEALRTLRTTLLGRIPGTGPPPLGPLQPIRLHLPGTALPQLALVARMDGSDGLVTARLHNARVATLHILGHDAPFHAHEGGLDATLRIADPPLWWPHTHGPPTLVDVEATIDGHRVRLARTGFRTVTRLPGERFALAINGVPVFLRGALWMGGDDLAPLHHARAAGMNMVRVPGHTAYPGAAFHDACDALGLLVWQDFMFARFDYPADPAFLAEADAEARHQLARLAHHPSLATLCGGHEVLQAAAMAGRPLADWAHPLFDATLPSAAADLAPGIPYVPHSPGGGALPFAASAPVAHAFGIGGYQRPLSDAAAIRFAAACLPFSNPPDPAGCRALSTAPGDAGWAASIPRDPGASWTFEDARDHYAAALFHSVPATLRRTDPDRWLAEGRAAVALTMQAAFTTWRVNPSCHGALVLALNDRVPGPGLGLLDHRLRPKSALHALAQVLQPVQVLLEDGGLDGVRIHLVNETPDLRALRLHLRALTPGGTAETLADVTRTLPPRSRETVAAVTFMGRFLDLTGAWRFGPPPFTVIGATLSEHDALVSEATLFPIGPALRQEDAGLHASLHGQALTVAARRFAQFVTVDDDHCTPDHDHIHLWPGESRILTLAGQSRGGTVTALNASAPAHYRPAA